MNTTMLNDNWIEANQHYLLAALTPVRNALRGYVAHVQSAAGAKQHQDVSPQVQEEIVTGIPAMSAPFALTKLCAAFGLSPFERDILLLCAGIDLDGTFAALCAAAQQQQWNERNLTIPYPTFSLALAALPRPHWDALTAAAPLRRWRLITVGNSTTLTLSLLRIDESILHYLVGISQPDERLAGIGTPLTAPTHLVPSHRLLAERCTAAWSRPIATANRLPLPQWGTACQIPIIQLCGEDSASMADIAATACKALGMRLCLVPVDALPAAASEIDVLIRLWEREAVLSGSALLLDCGDLDANDTAKMSSITRMMQHMNS
ncbi:MAG TPA: ATP-binding protein, partial [Ktedonobacteraceae bacterium]|nr:ATP-binding protein [Ktedonobacteraceae bacterium]